MGAGTDRIQRLALSRCGLGRRRHAERRDADADAAGFRRHPPDRGPAHSTDHRRHRRTDPKGGMAAAWRPVRCNPCVDRRTNRVHAASDQRPPAARRWHPQPGTDRAYTAGPDRCAHCGQPVRRPQARRWVQSAQSRTECDRKTTTPLPEKDRGIHRPAAGTPRPARRRHDRPAESFAD